jgi:hypothetical protein
VCAGCGGSGKDIGPGADISGDQNVVVNSGTSDSTVVAPAGSPQSATVTSEGQAQEVGVPGGEAIANGDAVFLMPNLFPIPDTGPGTAPTAVSTRNHLTAGELYFLEGGVFTDTGLHVNPGGQIVGNSQSFNRYVLRFPTSGNTREVTLVLGGPIHIGRRNKFLTVNESLSYTFVLSNNGALGSGLQSTFPTHVSYVLPANNGYTTGALFQVGLGFLQPGTSVPASMTVRWPGLTKSQTHTATNQLGALWDMRFQEQRDHVPADGITDASMRLVP